MTWKLKAIAAAALLATSTAAVAQELPDDVQGVLRERLKKQLLDPYSAMIDVTRGPRTARYEVTPGLIYEGKAICATVNAKNAYGGYAGAEPWVFFFHKSGGIGTWPMDSLLMQEFVVDECDKPADG